MTARSALPLLGELEARGLIHDTTDRQSLAARIERGPLTLYYGCDPTADSLHVGNLIGLVVLRRFQLAGHHPVALAGGATGMIGDPSGKSQERNLLDEETLARNVGAIKEQVSRIVGDVPLVDNLDWTRDVRLLDFLRDVGKHATVNQMIRKESVRARLEGEDGISYTEFTYMLLQARDYLVLHQERGCELQIGGSDQWGNITAGIDLIRRVHGEHVHGLTWPLIVRSDGRKFGKTEEGTVWLAAERTSAYQFFQYWMNVPDADAARFLRQLTLLPLDDIAAIEADAAVAPERRVAQRVLATEVTTLVHGAGAAVAAAEASEVLFGGSVLGASAAALEQVAAEVDTLRVAGLPVPSVVDVAVALGLCSSKGDARRQLQQGALSLNGAPLVDDRTLEAADLLHGRFALLRRGKRRYAVVELAP